MRATGTPRTSGHGPCRDLGGPLEGRRAAAMARPPEQGRELNRLTAWAMARAAGRRGRFRAAGICT